MRQLPTGNLKYNPATHKFEDDPDYMAALWRNARIPVQREVKKVKEKDRRKG